MEIIGHRGAKGLAPENTLEAINSALNLGVDMIEIDLRMQGKKIVLSHDDTLPNEKYTSVEEALGKIDCRVPLNIEIKEQKVIKPLSKVLSQYKGKILISSKSFTILQSVKKQLPDIDIAIIESWSGVRAVASASYLDTNRVHLKHNWLWSGFVRSMKHRGYHLYAYTVNSVERAEELESWGVDGIFTDYPDRFTKKIK
jgi:glycerophosphoryl diester phosphodiesterase